MSKELIELSQGKGASFLMLLRTISNKAAENAQQYAHQQHIPVTRDIYISFLKQELSDYLSRFKLDDEEIKNYCDILQEVEFGSPEDEKNCTDALAWLSTGLYMQSTQRTLSREPDENVEFLNQITQARRGIYLRNVYVECFQRPREDYAKHLSAALEEECRQWRFSDFPSIPDDEIKAMVTQINQGKKVRLSKDFGNGCYDPDLTKSIVKIVNKANLNAQVLQAGDRELKQKRITETSAPADYYLTKLKESARLSTPEHLEEINKDRHSTAQKVVTGFKLFVKLVSALLTPTALGLEDIAKEIDNMETREKISTGVEKFKEMKSQIEALKPECDSGEMNPDVDLDSQGALTCK